MVHYTDIVPAFHIKSKLEIELRVLAQIVFELLVFK